MRHRSYSLLRKSLVAIVIALIVQVAPRTLGLQSTVTAIIELKSQGNAQSIASKYGVILIDSIPELNKYLIQGNASSLYAVGKDHTVATVELNAEADLSERTMLKESTVALLDPDTVALLDDNNLIWDGQHWVKASVLQQPALQKISFTFSTAPAAPVTVAVIDTGIDPKHEMLVGSTLPGWNFIDPSRSTDELNDLDPATAALLQQFRGRTTGLTGVPAVLNPSTVALLDPAMVALMTQLPSLYFGHGTMVSGLIHAIAPSSLIMPLKAFDATGRGTSFRIAQAIVYGVNQGVDVINMSFSLDSASSLVQDALQYAQQHNVVLVASIGNSNSNSPKSYPASYGNVIGVGATDLDDSKASFSNWGPSSDVAAPGVGLISPYPAGLYAVWSGTSASAALVSGEAALLISQLNLKANDTSTRITDRSDHVHFNYPLGKGRINLKTALKK